MPSLRRLRQRLGLARLPPLPRPRPRGSEALTALPVPRHPAASVVVPAFANEEMTLSCLRALAAARVETSFEALLVDDGSPPGSLDKALDYPGVRVVVRSRNGGFVAAANAGAAAARGRFVVFLNNDTRVTEGWLDALLATFVQYPDCALAGAQLLLESGRVQEAGGVVWSDAGATHYGRGDHPDAPAYGFARRVDYCSGACLAVERDWFLASEGFAEAYAPGYYEDVDLAFRAREAGAGETYYQPLCRVFHREGGTAGTDLGSGDKRFQEVHRSTFASRWRRVLASQPRRGADLHVARERGLRGRCLVVDARLPRPDRDAGSARLRWILEGLRGAGFGVTFGALDLEGSRATVTDLQAAGIETLRRPFVGSWRRYLQRHGASLDSVILCRAGVYRRLAPLVRRWAPTARLVFDTVDLGGRREMARAEHEGVSAGRRRAARTVRREVAALRAADVVLSVSDIEHAEIARLAPGVECRVAPTYYRPRVGPGFDSRSGMAFIGGFRHAPNVDAVRWLVRELWPSLVGRLAEGALWIVGEEPPAWLSAAADDRLRVLGPVPDLDGLLDSVRLTVAPLRWGAGLKGKVHASLAAGVPCVGTPIAFEGFDVESGVHAEVASEPEVLIERTIALHENSDRWSRLSVAGRRLTEERYPLSRLTEAVVASVSATRHRK